MTTIIFGDGHLGEAIAAAIRARGLGSPVVLGRPVGGHHPAPQLLGTALAYEASVPGAVGSNIAAALAAGCRRFVIATTGWDDRHDTIDEALRRHDAAAVAAPNFSVGVAALLRLVEIAGSMFAHLDDVDPYIIEWHRRGKLDRPSGTAQALGRRLLAVVPRKRRIAPVGSEPPDPDELEIVSVRAGASPGMHVVGFDSTGETLELRLTARDRSAYAAGALAAGEWLRAEPRRPGIHAFSEVVDDLMGASSEPARDTRPKLRAVAGVSG